VLVAFRSEREDKKKERTAISAPNSATLEDIVVPALCRSPLAEGLVGTVGDAEEFPELLVLLVGAAITLWLALCVDADETSMNIATSRRAKRKAFG
jgi:hypothetical protein